METPIMEITIEKEEIEGSKEDMYLLWFVALAGYEGPRIHLPKSLLVNLRNKITEILIDG